MKEKKFSYSTRIGKTTFIVNAGQDGLLSDERNTENGILSPLLSNIVLNELDWWVSSNWENMPTRYEYYTTTSQNGTVSRSGAMEALKKTKVKEMRIVRYADDFKIFCRSYDATIRTFHVVKGWLKERLKLDISPEKSKIDRQAQERFERLIEGIQVQGITEQLKAKNALEWVGRLNNIRACAREIVNSEIVYV